jgi:hypothetical protein
VCRSRAASRNGRPRRSESTMSQAGIAEESRFVTRTVLQRAPVGCTPTTVGMMRRPVSVWLHVWTISGRRRLALRRQNVLREALASTRSMSPAFVLCRDRSRPARWMPRRALWPRWHSSTATSIPRTSSGMRGPRRPLLVAEFAASGVTTDGRSPIRRCWCSRRYSEKFSNRFTGSPVEALDIANRDLGEPAALVW